MVNLNDSFEHIRQVFPQTHCVAICLVRLSGVGLVGVKAGYMVLRAFVCPAYYYYSTVVYLLKFFYFFVL